MKIESMISQQIVTISEAVETYSKELESFRDLSNILESPEVLSEQSSKAKDISKTLEKLQETPLPSSESIQCINNIFYKIENGEFPSTESIQLASDVLTRLEEALRSLPTNEALSKQVDEWKLVKAQADAVLETINKVRKQLTEAQHEFIDAYPESKHLVIPADSRKLEQKELETIKNRLQYKYPKEKIITFLSALNTTQIIALCGKPGTGKTTFAEQMAQAIGACFHLIEVQNNWTDRSDLLGFYNPTNGTYQSTDFLEALLTAKADLKENGEKSHLHTAMKIMEETKEEERP